MRFTLVRLMLLISLIGIVSVLLSPGFESLRPFPALMFVCGVVGIGVTLLQPFLPEKPIKLIPSRQDFVLSNRSAMIAIVLLFLLLIFGFVLLLTGDSLFEAFEDWLRRKQFLLPR